MLVLINSFSCTQRNVSQSTKIRRGFKLILLVGNVHIQPNCVISFANCYELYIVDKTSFCALVAFKENLRFSSWCVGVMGEGISVPTELKQVTLLCFSGLRVTCRCRTEVLLGFACVVVCRQDSCTSLAPGGARHREVGSSGSSTLSHQAQEFFRVS